MFKDRATADIFAGSDSKAARKVCPSSLHELARRKLVVLVSAGQMTDLLIPPGNQLEEPHGDRQGQHSIRINTYQHSV
jgi:proteic killer suppression protein